MKDVMAEGDPPTIARRHVRMALREARESADLTQQEVAEQMEWSASKVIEYAIQSSEIEKTAVITQPRLLIDLIEGGAVELRMIPFDLDTPIADNGSFDLMTVGATFADSEVMYRENGMPDEILEDRAETTRHRKRFEQLWQVADDEVDTIEFIKGRITDLEKKLPRSPELTSSTLVLISAGRGP
jgi:transcriptional regulator with XRE-family HTH domain